MFPVGDVNPTRRFPVMTWLLFVINVVVFVYETRLGDRQLSRFVEEWGVVPADILGGFGGSPRIDMPRELFTLITSQFIHGGWLHIAGNMLFLLVFADNIEDRLGSVMFLAFYLFCGIVAAAVQIFFLAEFTGGLRIPNIGASGAIAGVLGAYLLKFPTKRVITIIPIFGIPIPFGIPAWILIGWWFVQQFFYGVLTLSPEVFQTTSVAFWAHVGGFVAGFLLMTLVVTPPPDRRDGTTFLPNTDL
jgi:membrane associated rhomboid family serine protease